MIKVAYGCYRQMFGNGWINTDILDLSYYASSHGYIFRKIDVRKPLPFRNDSVDLIYHSHLIEHLSFNQAINFLRECYRILKKDGVMRISTPDLDVFLDTYLNGGMDAFNYAQPEIYSKLKSQALKFSMITFGNLGYTQENYGGHFMIYNEESLREILSYAGFKNIYRVSHKTSIHPILQEELERGIVYDTWTDHSLVMEAKK